jgi:hypothetical protein
VLSERGPATVPSSGGFVLLRKTRQLLCSHCWYYYLTLPSHRLFLVIAPTRADAVGAVQVFADLTRVLLVLRAVFAVDLSAPFTVEVHAFIAATLAASTAKTSSALRATAAAKRGSRFVLLPPRLTISASRGATFAWFEIGTVTAKESVAFPAWFERFTVVAKEFATF